MANLQHVNRLIVFTLFMLAFVCQSWAGLGRTTYQAKIIKPDGYPLEATSVNFKFTILDPTGSCVLYSEEYTAVNMNNTGGLIFFSLGAGNRTYPATGVATLSSVFDNSVVSFSCQSPGLYTPTSSDNRKIVMQFNDGNGWQTLPAMAINAVPFSMYAGKAENSVQLNGKSDTAFVEYSSLASLNCQSNEAIKFNGVSFSCIPVGSGGGGITSVTTSGTVLLTGGTASAPVISIQTVSMSQDGYLTSLDYVEFKAKLSASSTQIINTLGYTPVSSSTVASQIASSTLSGDVSGNPGSNTVDSVGGKTANQISTSVNDTLISTSSATADTLVKRNSLGNSTFNDIYANAAKINYVDIYKPSTSFNIRLQAPTSLSANYNLTLPNTAGVSGQVISTDGAGNLSWINTATGSVTSVNANAPLSSTGGSTPTISITQATSSTDGYLSSTDWNTFNNKADSITVSALSGTVTSLQNSVATSFAVITSSQWTNNGSDIYYNTGYVGVGTSTPAAELDVSGTLKAGALWSGQFYYDDSYGLGIQLSDENFINAGSLARFNYSPSMTNPANNSFGSGAGLIVSSALDHQTGSTTSGTAIGVDVQSSVHGNSGGTVTQLAAVTARVGISAGNVNANTAYGVYVKGFQYGNGNINNLYGLYIDDATPGAGTISNNYGIYQKQATAKNYFAGNVGIGTTTPTAKLTVSGGVQISMESAACAVSYAGTLRYNGTAVEFCNGTIWSAFGVSGAGLQSLNGSTSGTQVFAVDINSSTPAFNTSNGVHTLSIPLAASGSVAAGLISNTDYTVFSNKMNATSAAVITALGYTPVSSTALGSFLQIANNLSDIASATVARINLGLGLLATKSQIDLSSTDVSGTLSAANLADSGVAAATYTKVTVDSKGRVTSGSQITASDITTALGYTPASYTALVSGTGTTWQIIARQSVATSATTINISGLDGNADQSYRVVYRVKHNVAGSTYVRLNNDTASNYAFNYLSSDGSTPTALAGAMSGMFAVGGSVTAGNVSFGEQIIAVETGDVRVGHGTVIQNSTGYAVFSTSRWNNTTSNVTSIQLSSSVANGIGAGSYLEIWAKRKPAVSEGWSLAASSALVVTDLNQKVGIGTSSPNAELDVSGTIRATQICDRNGNNCQTISSGWSGMSGSGTTMVSGWPDSIRCKSSGGIDYILYLSGDYDSSLRKYYATTRSSTGDQNWMVYNTDGTYYSHLNMGGGFDCVTSAMSITQLYNANQAYKFVGGGSGTVSQVTAVAPLLVSGTASSQISIATSGSTSGQTLRFDGTNWQRTKLLYTDLVNATAASPWPASSCSAGQAVVWSSASDSFVCSTIQIASSQLPQMNLASTTSGGVTGILPIANGGTGLSSVGVSGAVLTSNGSSATWTTLDALTTGQNNTMVSGWPDAISCYVSSPNYGRMIFILMYHDYVPTGLSYYRATAGSTNLDVVFNASTKAFSAYQNLTTTDCNISIANLYAQGKAFNFAKGPVGQWLQNGSNAYYNAGNVGIGTASPQSKFELSDSSNIRSIIRNSTESTAYNSSLDFVTGAGALASTNVVARVVASITQADPSALQGDLIFHTNAGDNTSEKMRVTSVGNVGIGTSSPAQRLSVAGTIESTTGGFKFPDGSIQTTATSATEGLRGAAVAWVAFNGATGAIQSSFNINSVSRTALGRYVVNFSQNLADTNYAVVTGGVNTGNGDGAWASVDNIGGSGKSVSGVRISSWAYNGGAMDYPETYVAIYQGNGTASLTNLFTESGSNIYRATGNVGIGTSNLFSKLQVRTGTDQNIGIEGPVGLTSGATINVFNDAHSVNVPLEIRASVVAMGLVGGHNVGVGTTSPGSKLTISRATEAASNQLELRNEGGISVGNYDGLRFTQGAAGATPLGSFRALYQTNGAPDLAFYTRDAGFNTESEKMRILNNGNVGIGLAVPTALLHVNGAALATAWNTSSDKRLKENIKPIENSVDKILLLRGVEFDWRKDVAAPTKHDEPHDIGVIAQEVEKVFPEAVTTPEKGFKSVSYSKLVAPLIEAVKSLYYRVVGIERDLGEQKRQIASVVESKADKAEIEKLKAENAAKTKEIDALKSYLCSKDPAAPICK